MSVLRATWCSGARYGLSDGGRRAAPRVAPVHRAHLDVGNAAPPQHQSRSAPRTGNRYNCRDRSRPEWGVERAKHYVTPASTTGTPSSDKCYLGIYIEAFRHGITHIEPE